MEEVHGNQSECEPKPNVKHLQQVAFSITMEIIGILHEHILGCQEDNEFIFQRVEIIQKNIQNGENIESN
jgi:hypothetical protein